MFPSSVPVAASALVLAGLSFASVAPTATAQAKDPEALRAQIREKRSVLTKQRADAIGPVTVNGKALTPEAVQRAAIYLVGARKVEAKISDFFVLEYLDEAIKNGRPEKDFEITEEELRSELEGTVAEFRKKYPEIDFWEAVEAQTGFGREEYLVQQRQTKLFDKVFFPGAPEDWPSISREAIKASAQGADGQAFWDRMIETGTDPAGNPQPLPAFWMTMCRGWVQKQLKSWSDIQYPSDGLDPSVALRVNGRDWPTSEAFDFVKTSLSNRDIETAMKEVVILEALRQELVAKGAYLSDDDFRKAFDEYQKPYEGSPFTVEVIAVNFRGFPSLEAFRARWRLIRSFQNLIADEMTDEGLQAHAEEYARFFAEGQVVVDMIPFLARDLQTAGWLPNGLEEAEKRAMAVMKRLEAGESFDELLTSEGEFFSNDKERGRLGSKTLNQLRQSMRENEFLDLLRGFSLGDYLFYEAPVGKVVGPLEGPDGYFLARVSNRLPARQKPNISQPRTRELVEQDFVNRRFLEWANEVMARTEIR